MKEPHTSIFIGQAGCGNTHLVLEWIEKKCNNNFDYILSPVQHSEKIIKPIMLESRSKAMIMFG